MYSPPHKVCGVSGDIHGDYMENEKEDEFFFFGRTSMESNKKCHAISTDLFLNGGNIAMEKKRWINCILLHSKKAEYMFSEQSMFSVEMHARWLLRKFSRKTHPR